MNQEQLRDYLLEHGCYIYKEKQKEDGIHYYFRRNDGSKNISVVYPLTKHPFYSEAAVCHICETLELDEDNVPEYARKFCKHYSKFRKKASGLDDLPPTGYIVN